MKKTKDNVCINRKMREFKDGITLISLIITIIVLLILAGVTILTLTGENGLLERAKMAKNKNQNATIEENTVLDDYTNKIDNYLIGNTRENNVDESQLITSAVLTIESIAKTSFSCNINVSTENESNIADYHVYVRNINTGEKKVFINTQNIIKAEDGIAANTNYEVYAIVCDLDGKFKKTDTIKVTTLEADTLTIDAVLMTDPYWGSYPVTAEGATTVLFNKIISENSMTYKGILMSTNDYIEITINKPCKIYAYGYNFVDSGGSSNKDLVVKRLNNGTYENYKTVATNTSGSKYELVSLESGKYRLYASSRYINFTEWNIETIS